MSKNIIPRDISWLSFNARVLQEAGDLSVELSNRIRFLGIFSNNLDEFFRVRVAVLKRAASLDQKISSKIFYDSPQRILDIIQSIVIHQQEVFKNTWQQIQQDMAKEKVFIKTAAKLNEEQKKFITEYFHEEVESNIIPIMLHENKPMPYVREHSLYLGIAMRQKSWLSDTQYAIIEVPLKFNNRFVLLPSSDGSKNIMLLEDIIIQNLPYIFSYFNFSTFNANAFQISKDAEFDLDHDITSDFAEQLEKAIKDRRKGKPTRFVFDKDMNPGLFDFLIKKLKISSKDSIIPTQRTLNFRDFMDFPNIIKNKGNSLKLEPFEPSDLTNLQSRRISDVILKKDILLVFPYHKYNPVIDLLRESAIDPLVESIQITSYRLASNSKIANALINAARNGKQVTVMVELRARFDEENNLIWVEKFEQEGIKVLVGVPNMKVHAKLCNIKKVTNNKTIEYGFISTGNFNEKTAKFYGDMLLMTSKKQTMADINRVFKFLRAPDKVPITSLNNTKSLLLCPTSMKQRILQYIDKEIAAAKAKRKAHIIIKVNSLSDVDVIRKINEAIAANVRIEMIVRGIFCVLNKEKYTNFTAISIVDEYLEHARVMYFYNGGKEEIYISSADWMPRNLDHRVEAAVRITDSKIKTTIKNYLRIQLSDNVKARILNADLDNEYVKKDDKNPIRSQIEIYNYLLAMS